MNIVAREKNRNLTKRAQAVWSQTGRPLYEKIDRIWKLILFSYVLDLFLFTRQFNLLPTEVAIALAGLASGLLFPLLSKERFHRYLHLLRASQYKSVEKDQKIFVVLALLIAFLATGAKIGLAVQLPLIPALVVAFMIAFAALRGGKKVVQDMRKERERFKAQPFAQVERWEEQVIVLSITPMLLARVISALGVIQTTTPESSLALLLPFSLVSITFLAMLKPSPQSFRGFCPRCRQPVPLVVVTLGSCSKCDPSFLK